MGLFRPFYNKEISEGNNTILGRILLTRNYQFLKVKVPIVWLEIELIDEPGNTFEIAKSGDGIILFVFFGLGAFSPR